MSDKLLLPVIEHLKSGLAISSHMGCTLNCAYCLLYSGSGKGNRVRMVSTADELIRRLKEPDSLFLDGMTPLFINNRTDPFLPEVEKNTFRILDLLAENGVRSPVVLVSKMTPSASLQAYCKALPLMFIYSYSALREDANYHSIGKISRLTSFLDPVSLFHYMRPIIPGKNDDLGMLWNTIRTFADAGFSGTIVSGIRITRGNYRYLSSNPASADSHKLLPHTVYDSLLQDLALSGLCYPLFRHTSCAIDSFMKRGNRLGYYQWDHHCNPGCLNRFRCASAYALTDEARAGIAAKFPKMVFSYDADHGDMIIETPVSQEITAFLKNAYGIRVTAKKLILSPSEEVLADG